MTSHRLQSRLTNAHKKADSHTFRVGICLFAPMFCTYTFYFFD